MRFCSRSWFLLFLLFFVDAGLAAGDELVVAPGDVITLTAPGSRVSVEVALDGGVLHPLGNPPIAPDSGDHWLTVATRDAAGRRSELEWYRLRVDGEAPVLRWIFDPEPVADEEGRQWFPPGAVVVVAGDDSPAGVKEIALRVGEVDAVPSADEVRGILEGEGENIVSTFAVDRVGNRSVAEVRSLWVDSRSPVGSLDLKAPHRSTSGVFPVVGKNATVGVVWNDHQSGIAETASSVDGLQVSQANPLTGWSEGKHIVTTGATDRVGNVAEDVALHFIVDETPPTVGWTVVSSHSVEGERGLFVRPPVMVEIRAEDAVAGVGRVEWNDGSGWSVATDVVESGANGLRMRAFDRVENLAEEEIVWINDAEGPAISLVSPDGDELVTVGGVIVVAAGAVARLAVEDRGVGLADVRQRLDTWEWSPPPDRYIFDHSRPRTLEVEATDLLGNICRRTFRVEVKR